MKKIDFVYLKDVLEAISQVEKFIGKSSFAEFEQKDMVQFAVFHALEVVGEAVNKLSKDFCDVNPKFPTKEAIELRNFLIHGYDQIRLDVVWKTIKENLPALKKQIKAILT